MLFGQIPFTGPPSPKGTVRLPVGEKEARALARVTEHFDGDAGRCWLTLVLERPVAIDKAATICGDCPRYVAGSLPCVDG